MIRVYVADDHAVVRQGIIRILRQQSDLEIAGEAGSLDELTVFFSADSCDVLLLDVNIQGKTSLETLKNIRASHPGTKILVLSMYPAEQYAIRFIKAGAAGYLTKDAAPDELVHAILRIANGGHYLSQGLAELALFGTGDDIPHEGLSDREYEVMLGIARGRRIREIAAGLELSEKTVSTYRSRILKKLGCGSNAEIVEYALRNGLIG
jgi:DNA-binding NarL/FixJ family response regulator